MRPNIFLVAVLAVAPLPSVAAQEDPFRPRRPGQVKPGDRVRVWAPEFGIQKQVGTLRALRGDTLTVDTLRLAFASVTRLEVSLGRKSRVREGALIGAAIGAGTGAILGFAIASSERCFSEPEPCPGVGALIGAVSLSVPGVLLGTIVGAGASPTIWVEVPLDFLRVSFAPQRDGRFGLGLSYAF